MELGRRGKRAVGSWDYWAPEQACVGRWAYVFKEPVVLVAAGSTHAACVTSKGVLYTWGNGKHGELGDGFQEIRLNPQQINLATHGGEPAVMVSCGASHTVVLTEAGCVWTSGDGQFGKLGMETTNRS